MISRLAWRIRWAVSAPSSFGADEGAGGAGVDIHRERAVAGGGGGVCRIRRGIEIRVDLRRRSRGGARGRRSCACVGAAEPLEEEQAGEALRQFGGDVVEFFGPRGDGEVDAGEMARRA